MSRLKRAEPGVIVRPADAEIIPPLSDYEAFWEQLSEEARVALDHIHHLRAACDRDGNLPRSRSGEVGALVGMLEARLQ